MHCQQCQVQLVFSFKADARHHPFRVAAGLFACRAQALKPVEGCNFFLHFADYIRMAIGYVAQNFDYFLGVFGAFGGKSQLNCMEC